MAYYIFLLLAAFFASETEALGNYAQLRVSFFLFMTTNLIASFIFCISKVYKKFTKVKVADYATALVYQAT